MIPEPRRILHCDLNAFYASVEIRLNPALRTRPMAVGGSVEQRHGIILAKSEQAKRAGVRTGDTLAEARSKCPELHIVPPHFDAYAHYSRAAKAIYRDYCTQIEPFGADECWLDLSPLCPNFASAAEVARELLQRFQQELGLSLSIGLAANKVYAKLASDMKKPNALTVLEPEQVERLVYPLPVEDLLGVGPATRRRLARYGIRSIGQLARAERPFLKAIFGVRGPQLAAWAAGEDSSPVRPDGWTEEPQTISHGLTTHRDLEDREDCFTVLLALAQELAMRLREEGVRARGIGVFYRLANLEGRQHHHLLPEPIQNSGSLASEALRCLLEHYDFSQGIRAIGISTYALESEQNAWQCGFLPAQRQAAGLARVERCFDPYKARYGLDCLRPARLLLADRRSVYADQPHPPGLLL